MQDSDIKSAAADWDARLRSQRCSDADRSNFRVWCDEDRRHRDAFDRLQRALAALRQAADHPQVRALREMASVGERRFSARRLVWGVALSASLVAGVIALISWTDPQLATVPRSAAAPQFSTSSDERRTVALPDGSSVTLNSATHIEAEWLSSGRRVRLVSGQALFRVAKDPTRPFVVTVGDRTVTALGTVFDVKLDADKVQVTLVEGRVAVRGLGKAAAQPITELAPHEQFVAIVGDLATVRSVDVAATVGWAEYQVFFTDEGLAYAVAEMNRHSAEQIVLGDPALAQYRVNGMFRAGNQRGFVSALSTYYPIEYRRDDAGHIVLTRRQNGTDTK